MHGAIEPLCLIKDNLVFFFFIFLYIFTRTKMKIIILRYYCMKRKRIQISTFTLRTISILQFAVVCIFVLCLLFIFLLDMSFFNGIYTHTLRDKLIDSNTNKRIMSSDGVCAKKTSTFITILWIMAMSRRPKLICYLKTKISCKCCSCIFAAAVVANVEIVNFIYTYLHNMPQWIWGTLL